MYLREHHEHVQVVANYFWLGPVVSEAVRLMVSRRSSALTVSFIMKNGCHRHSVRAALMQGKEVDENCG
jgi:hypothetical protein